jgi:hypothetical protein
MISVMAMFGCFQSDIRNVSQRSIEPTAETGYLALLG